MTLGSAKTGGTFSKSEQSAHHGVMRIVVALLTIFSWSCDGSQEPLNPGTPPPTDNPMPMPGCEPCATALSAEADLCGPMLSGCIDPPNETLEQDIACFQADGRCYQVALDRSSACHRGCGDEEQANVETCAGVCFTDRADCAESALRFVDTCLDFARTQADADACTNMGVQSFERCDQTIVNCTEMCKRVHRDG